MSDHALAIQHRQHAHQRQIMAVLGMDVWTTRLHITQVSDYAIYRDQHNTAQPFLDHLALTQHDLTTSAPDLAHQAKPSTSDQIQIENQIQAHHSPPLAKNNSSHLQDIAQRDTLLVQAATAQQHEIESALEIAAFELQACIFENVALLVDSQHLNTQQVQLWLSIQKSQNSQLRALTWPFPMLEFQDGHGAAAYVRGFVHALGSDLKLIHLGACPYIEGLQINAAPSLAQMLDQPQLKRQLWQLMRDIN